MLKIRIDQAERYATYIAMGMFFLLGVLSLVKGKTELLPTARNVVLLAVGLGGLLTFTELDQFRRMRISRKRKRILFYAQSLLLACSITLLVYSMLQLDLISGLSRWD